MREGGRSKLDVRSWLFKVDDGDSYLTVLSIRYALEMCVMEDLKKAQEEEKSPDLQTQRRPETAV